MGSYGAFDPGLDRPTAWSHGFLTDMGSHLKAPGVGIESFGMMGLMGASPISATNDVVFVGCLADLVPGSTSGQGVLGRVVAFCAEEGESW